jgi:hypothetical protein
MEDTFDSTAVKARVLDRVGREARWYRYRLPILIGNLGGLALFALYLTFVTVAQGWQHAIELFRQDAWLVIPIMIGFGVEVGLYTHLRGVIRRGLRQSKMMMGAGGATSTAAMVACCAHHVADVLPLLGLSAVASFLAAYKIPFMLIGLAMNVIGIIVIVRAIRKEQRYLDRLKSDVMRDVVRPDCGGVQQPARLYAGSDGGCFFSSGFVSCRRSHPDQRRSHGDNRSHTVEPYRQIGRHTRLQSRPEHALGRSEL